MASSSFGTTQCWIDGSDEYPLHTAMVPPSPNSWLNSLSPE
jgi:hypothetical protein